MRSDDTSPTPLAWSCMAQFFVCACGVTVFMGQLSGETREGGGTALGEAALGAFLVGAWLAALQRRNIPALVTLASASGIGLVAAMASGLLVPAMLIFALAVGFAEVFLSALLVESHRSRAASSLMLSHAGWPAGFLMGALVNFALAEQSPALSFAFLAVNLAGSVWILGRIMPRLREPGASPASARWAPLLLAIPLMAVTGCLEFRAEPALLSRIPAGLATRWFLVCTLLLIGIRFFCAVHLAGYPGHARRIALSGAALGLLGLLAAMPAGWGGAFILPFLLFLAGKSVLWPAVMAMGLQGSGPDVRFRTAVLVTTGVIAPALLLLLWPSS